MSGSDFSLEVFLPYRLAVAATRVSEEFAKSYQTTHGLNRAEWRIISHLSELNDDQALSVRDLEARIHLEKSKVSRAVTRLEGKGLVKKTPREDDARLLEISLTPQGAEVFQDLVPIANEYQAMLMEKLSAEERERLMSALVKLGDI